MPKYFPNRIAKILPQLSLFFFLAFSVVAQNTPAKPELVLQTGHTAAVKCAVFSPDGNWLASGGLDNVVKIWDLASGRELRTLRGHAGYVNALALSRDGKILASGSNDKTIKIWNVTNGALLQTFTGHTKPVLSLAFSPDGRWLASGGADNNFVVWEVSSGKQIFKQAQAAAVTALAFSPDGQMFAFGDAARNFGYGYTKDWQVIQVVTSHQQKVAALTFTADGKAIASGGADGTVALWQIALKKSIALGGGDPVLSLTATSNQLLIGRTDGQISARDVETGRLTPLTKVRAGDAETVNKLNLLTFSADGKQVAAGIGDRNITIRVLAQSDNTIQLTNRSSVFLATAFSPDGRWFASGTNENVVRLWDVKTGREIAKLFGLAGYVNSVAFSPGGGFLAAGSLSGRVKIWDLDNGNREIFTLTAHEEGVNAVAFSPDAKLLATGSTDSTIKLWNMADGSLSRALKGHTGEVSGIAFNAEGNFLASVSADQTTRLWDMNNQAAEPRVLLKDVGVARAVAFSPDGKWLAAAADKQLTIWAAPFENPASSIPQTQALNALSFSRDNKTLAASGFGREVKLVDVSAGKERKQLAGHTATVNGLCFSPDPHWLISASEDGSMIVWDVEQGTSAATLVSGFQNEDWLVVTPDGLFDGSPAAWQQILWRYRGETFSAAPVEIFFNDYFYPGLLADIFGNKTPKAAVNLSEKDRRQPVIALKQNSTANPRNVRLTIAVSEAAAGSGAKDLRLFRNGVLIKIWRGDVLHGKATQTIEFTAPIVAGPNQFSVYAFNRDNIKSSDAAVALNGPESLRRKGVAHVIAIGINEYANPQYNLKLAGADAQSVIQAVAKAQERLDQFERFEVTPLFDKDATKANILAAIRRLSDPNAPLPPNAPPVLANVKLAQPEDAVVIFYAGHGVAEKDRWYMLPHDLGYTGARDRVDAQAVATVLAHSVSDLELEEAIEGIDASGILLILDACNSGQALNSEEKRRGPMNSRGLAQLAYEKGMFLLAAAESYQLALESTKLGHGYLTYTLVEEGLSGMADTAPKDGLTFAQEWLRYAARRVPELQLERENIKAGKPMPPTVSREFGLGGPKKPIPSPKKLPRVEDVQRPRLFYRQELDKTRLVVARNS